MRDLLWPLLGGVVGSALYRIAESIGDLIQIWAQERKLTCRSVSEKE